MTQEEVVDVVEQTVEEVVVNKVDETKVEQEKSFVKIREEKAQKQILKQLGVTSVDEALAKLNAGDEALKRINELEQKIQKAEQDKITDLKSRQVISMLENEKAFDSEALLHYVNLDAIELDSNGKIKESEKLLGELKSLKPNYFGREVITSDSYVQGDKTEPKSDYEDDYKSGNYVGAIAKYLKTKK